MTTHPVPWTEQEILQLPGQAASLTVEFETSKSIRNLTNLRKRLSRHISAFANAEGGVIVLGIRTKGRKPPVATELEGVDPDQLSYEYLEAVVKSCVQPHLPEFTCRTVPLPAPHDGRVLYTISVPKGYTAYQADDYVYYTRTGYSSEAMPDHLVRLLMLRGSAPRATLEIGNCEILSKGQADEYRFDLIVKNTGERTLREVLLELTIAVNDDSLQLWAPTLFVDREEAILDELRSVETMLQIGEDITDYKRHEILHGPGISFHSGENLRCSLQRIMQVLYQVNDKVIFPRDRLIFPGGKWLIEGVPHDSDLRQYAPTLAWTLYVDNALPYSGTLDLAAPFQQQDELFDDFFADAEL